MRTLGRANKADKPLCIKDLNVNVNVIIFLDNLTL